MLGLDRVLSEQSACRAQYTALVSKRVYTRSSANVFGRVKAALASAFAPSFVPAIA